MECYLEMAIACYMIFLVGYNEDTNKYVTLKDCEEGYVMPPPDMNGKILVDCYTDYKSSVSVGIIIMVILFLVLPLSMIMIIRLSPKELEHE